MRLPNIEGKSRQEIQRILQSKDRHELLDIIARLASLEPMYSPTTIAAAREITPRTVLELMKSGVIDAHLVSHNRYRATASAVHAWDEQTALRLESEVCQRAA